MPSRYYVDEDTITTVIFDGPVTSVTIFGDNIHARGNAKHDPADKYSETFGENLATARAQSRYARKVERRLVRSTR